MRERNGKCWRCGCNVPPEHGYCSPCAWWQDGFDAGATYCDDFEGTTAEDVSDYAAQSLENGIFDDYAADLEPTDDRAHALKQYSEGLIEGLKISARYNAEREAERAEETDDAERAFGPHQAKNYRGRDGY